MNYYNNKMKNTMIKLSKFNLKTILTKTTLIKSNKFINNSKLLNTNKFANYCANYCTINKKLIDVYTIEDNGNINIKNECALVALLGLLYYLGNDDIKKEYIVNEKNKFFKFEKHTNLEDLENNIGGSIISLTNFKKLKFDEFNNAVKDLEPNDQELIKKIMAAVVFDYADRILFLNGKMYSNLYSIIFVGKKSKIILINDTMEKPNMINLVINLDFNYK